MNIKGPLWSDANVATHPTNDRDPAKKKFVEVSKQKAQIFVAQLSVIVREFLVHEFGEKLNVNAKLNDLPMGYKLFSLTTSNGASEEMFLYGHPSGFQYISVEEFFPHMKWLLTDTARNHCYCGCKLCSKFVQSWGPTTINGNPQQSENDMAISDGTKKKNPGDSNSIKQLINNPITKPQRETFSVSMRDTNQSHPSMYQNYPNEPYGRKSSYDESEKNLPQHKIQGYNRDSLPNELDTFYNRRNSTSVNNQPSAYHESYDHRNSRNDLRQNADAAKDSKSLHDKNVRYIPVGKMALHTQVSHLNPSPQQTLNKEVHSRNITHQPYVLPPQTHITKSTPSPRVNWDDSQFRISEMVWVPVVLFLKEERNSILLSGTEKSIDISHFKTGFTYWPAIVQNIFSCPLKEMWYSPLCIEEASGGMNVISSQIFRQINRTNIPYAYSLKLLNLKMMSEPILAQEDILPYVGYKISPCISKFSISEMSLLKSATRDSLLFAIINSYIQASSVSQKLQRLNNESKANIYCNVELKDHEFEIISFVFGPEVIKVNDIVRVKVKSADEAEFKMLYFRVRAIVLDKIAEQMFIHGERQVTQPSMMGAPGSFLENGKWSVWTHFSQQLFQIRTDRLLGRFYTHFPNLEMHQKIDIVNV